VLDLKFFKPDRIKPKWNWVRANFSKTRSLIGFDSSGFSLDPTHSKIDPTRTVQHRSQLSLETSQLSRVDSTESTQSRSNVNLLKTVFCSICVRFAPISKQWVRSS